MPVIDFVAGTLGGVGSVLSGHPFDTLKVRMQTSSVVYNDFQSPIDCFFKTLKREGIRGLYKGVTPPLMVIPVAKTVLFGANGTFVSYFRHENEKNRVKNVSIGDPNLMSNGLYLSQTFLSGMGAGMVASLITCPTDLLKCRLQTQYHDFSELFVSGSEKNVQLDMSQRKLQTSHQLYEPIQHSRYRGIADAIKKIFQENGIRGFWRGWPAQIAREMPGYALYFTSYEYFKHKLLSSRNGKPLEFYHLFFCGGFAGVVYWIPTFPIDQVKSRVQTQADKKPLYLGFRDGFRRLLQDEGPKGFFRGFAPTMLRAFFANAGSLTCYDLSKKYLSFLFN